MLLFGVGVVSLGWWGGGMSRVDLRYEMGMRAVGLKCEMPNGEGRVCCGDSHGHGFPNGRGSWRIVDEDLGARGRMPGIQVYNNPGMYVDDVSQSRVQSDLFDLFKGVVPHEVVQWQWMGYMYEVVILYLRSHGSL